VFLVSRPECLEADQATILSINPLGKAEKIQKMKARSWKKVPAGAGLRDEKRWVAHAGPALTLYSFICLNLKFFALFSILSIRLLKAEFISLNLLANPFI